MALWSAIASRVAFGPLETRTINRRDSTRMEMPNQTNEPMLRAILAEYEIPYSLLERHAAAVPEIGDETEIDTIMTPALAFLRDLILPLAAEPDTCFVAMPFSLPYDDRYAALYQPMMRRVGYRTLRAWGGLSNEFHFDLLLTLIGVMSATSVKTLPSLRRFSNSPLQLRPAASARHISA